MKTLVVCLDGTGQTKTQEHPTNIARLFDALGGTTAPADPTDYGSVETAVGTPATLLGKYLPGVGTQGDMALKVLGNLFGDGIAEPIVRGYTFLSRNYDAGDEILITGFSRGATAARALAGFVVGQGLLDRGGYDPSVKNAAYLRAVAAWYTYRKQRPDFANQLRLDLIQGLYGLQVPQVGAADFTPPPTIKAVGVFDTVSSLGLPSLDANGDAKFDFSICDTVLSDKVENGFHALAADEMRDLFSPTYWSQRDRVTQQVFPGAHSDVGGGYPNRGLSDAALEWMLDMFSGVGMVSNSGLLNPPLQPNPLAIAQDDGATFPFNDTPRRARAFPESVLLSDPLDKRWGQDTQMLPDSALQPYKAKGVYADGRPLRS